MRFVHRLAVAAFAGTVVSPLPLSGQTDATARAREEVVAANDAELAAVIRGDAAAAAAFFLDDGILLPPDGGRIEGREAIEAFWTPQPGTRILGASTEVDRFDVRGDLAFLVGSYVLDVSSAGETSRSEGRFFMIWRQRPEGWRIEVDMWN